MMTSNGPPTLKGVGGPSPPLVSRGSEEGWEMEIPTMGFPSEEGGGGLDPPPLRGGALPLPWGNGGEPLWAGVGISGPSPFSREQGITP